MSVLIYPVFMSVVVFCGSVMPLNFVYCSKHIAVAADHICLPSPTQPMGGTRVNPVVDAGKRRRVYGVTTKVTWGRGVPRIIIPCYSRLRSIVDKHIIRHRRETQVLRGPNSGRFHGRWRENTVLASSTRICDQRISYGMLNWNGP